MDNHALAQQYAAELDFSGYQILQVFQIVLEEANLHKKAAIVGIWLEELDAIDLMLDNTITELHNIRKGHQDE